MLRIKHISGLLNLTKDRVITSHLQGNDNINELYEYNSNQLVTSSPKGNITDDEEEEIMVIEERIENIQIGCTFPGCDGSKNIYANRKSHRSIKNCPRNADNEKRQGLEKKKVDVISQEIEEDVNIIMKSVETEFLEVNSMETKFKFIKQNEKISEQYKIIFKQKYDLIVSDQQLNSAVAKLTELSDKSENAQKNIDEITSLKNQLVFIIDVSFRKISSLSHTVNLC